jgi:hypothetical protein
MNMMTGTIMMVAATLLAGVLCANGADVASAKVEGKFYKDWPLFSAQLHEVLK